MAETIQLTRDTQLVIDEHERGKLVDTATGHALDVGFYAGEIVARLVCLKDLAHRWRSEALALRKRAADYAYAYEQQGNRTVAADFREVAGFIDGGTT